MGKTRYVLVYSLSPATRHQGPTTLSVINEAEVCFRTLIEETRQKNTSSAKSNVNFVTKLHVRTVSITIRDYWLREVLQKTTLINVQ